MRHDHHPQMDCTDRCPLFTGNGPAHGTASRYERYGCRCEECKTEHTAKMRRYREKRRLTGWKAP